MLNKGKIQSISSGHTDTTGKILSTTQNDCVNDNLHEKELRFYFTTFVCLCVTGINTFRQEKRWSRNTTARLIAGTTLFPPTESSVQQLKQCFLQIDDNLQCHSLQIKFVSTLFIIIFKTLLFMLVLYIEKLL